MEEVDLDKLKKMAQKLEGLEHSKVINPNECFLQDIKDFLQTAINKTKFYKYIIPKLYIKSCNCHPIILKDDDFRNFITMLVSEYSIYEDFDKNKILKNYE